MKMSTLEPFIKDGDNLQRIQWLVEGFNELISRLSPWFFIYDDNYGMLGWIFHPELDVFSFLHGLAVIRGFLFYFLLVLPQWGKCFHGERGHIGTADFSRLQYELP